MVASQAGERSSCYYTQLLLFILLSTNTFQTTKSRQLENLVAAFSFQGFGQDYRHMCLGHPDCVCYNVFLICDFSEDF